jgi:uncharacterized protein YqjF (DUF2071 family)
MRREAFLPTGKKMKIPTLAGTIKRRILVNYRADPDVIQKILPEGFRPKLQDGKAVAGICLIRLENIRPKFAPAFIGLDSENAAHRISVEWEEDGETKEGVFIPRRDTNSRISEIAGGTLFPGEHNHAEFNVTESDDAIDFAMHSSDGKIDVELKGSFADELPSGSIFTCVDEASEFFRAGSLGYSVTKANKKLDGITLETKEWKVRPVKVDNVRSSFYEDKSIFPDGSIVYDHTLIMQDVEHEWHSAPEFELS